MKKRIFSVLFSVLISFSVLIGSVPVHAETVSENSQESSPINSENQKSSNHSSENQNPDLVQPKNRFSYDSMNIQSSLYENKEYFQNQNIYIRDEAQIFESGELAEIQKEIQNTADSINMNIALFIGGNYRNDRETEEFTISALKSIFGNEPDTNSIMLYLDFEGHKPSYDYIRTQHDAKLYITGNEDEGRISEILESMYRHLPASGEDIYRYDVHKGITAFCSEIKYFFNEKGMIDREYYYNEESRLYRYSLHGKIVESQWRPYRYPLLFLAIGLILSFIIAIITRFAIKKHYQFRVSQDTSVYTNQNNIRLLHKKDQFVGEYTTKVRIESDSHSGGGGGGGGGSFGGGGGHR